MPNDPIILVRDDDPERRPQLYACGKCGKVHSPNIYLASDEVKHATALRAAIECYNCRTHNACQDCGAPCEKHWLVCPPCRRERIIKTATKVDPNEIEHCFSLDGQSFYYSVEDAREAGEEWITDATFRPFSLDAQRIVDDLLADHHEDASTDDLDGLKELLAAIEKFNKAQKSGSYDQDKTRVAYIGDVEPD